MGRIQQNLCQPRGDAAVTNKVVLNVSYLAALGSCYLLLNKAARVKTSFIVIICDWVIN